MERARALLASLCLLMALLVLAWGCDMSALPTPTPVASTATIALSPTLTLTLPPSPTAIPATLPPSTPVPPEPTDTPRPPATATEEPSPTTAPPPPPTFTARPRPTSPPVQPTSTTSGPAPQATSTRAASGPTATNEPPPPGGWSEVVRGYTGKKQVALTFDAGANGEPMPAILAALRERNVRITMFFTGKFAEQYSDGVRQAVADGHEIANHTYSHRDSRELSDDELIEELARTERILFGLTGVSSKPYWRPPYGARNNHVLNVAVAQGYRSIFWTLDSLDSVGNPKTPEFIFERVTNTPNFNLDGAIILQHFGSEASAQALPLILDRLQEMGYRVVTISELLTP